MSATCFPQVANVYPVEPLPTGWMTAQVNFRHRDGREETRIEIIDLSTQKRYLHEPLRMIASKCFLLFLGIPFYTAGYIAWNLIRIPTTTSFALLDAFEKIFQSRSLGELVQRLSDTAWIGAETAIRGIWTVVRAPFYAIQMFFGALVGIFFPLQGRKMLGVETELHQKTHHRDLRHVDESKKLDAICSSLKFKDNPDTVFIAHCMQPLGKISDPHIISVLPLVPQ